MTVYTFDKIVEKAESCYNNIKTKHKNGINDRWSYYICKAIITPHKNIKKIGVNYAPNPVKTSIDKEISKSDYLKIIKKYIDFVEGDEHHNLPNFITIAGVKVGPYMFNAFVSYILVKYVENNKLPSKQGIKSSIYDEPDKLRDYLTSSGCSGMGQCTGYNCACNSLQQAFYRLTGIKVDESTIAKWAGTTTSGTDHQGINTAVAMFNKKYKKNIKIVWHNFSDLGWNKISELMKKGAVFCHLLYRDQWGHYEVPKTVRDDDLLILNSLGNQCGGGTYCGYIETRTKSTQKRYISGISQKSVAYLYNG